MIGYGPWLEGPGGVLAHIRRVLEKKEHCVVVVAEGAGQEILGAMGEFDASGNPVLQNFAKYLQKAGGAVVYLFTRKHVRFFAQLEA